MPASASPAHQRGWIGLAAETVAVLREPYDAQPSATGKWPVMPVSRLAPAHPPIDVPMPFDVTGVLQKLITVAC